MTAAWVLQANPEYYDIDGAIRSLQQIWWRTPQYAPDIQVGDAVVIWRSGSEAGIVGVGRVIAPPQLHAMEAEDRQFVLKDVEGPEAATRALIAVKGTKFVPKERIRSIPELANHRIVLAPMGTVFALSQDEWDALAPHVAAPEAIDGGKLHDLLPPVLAWEQRAKGVLPMPGGYDGYLISTRKVCDIVTSQRPTSEQLVGQMQQAFGVTRKAASLRESFLRKMGLVVSDGGSLRVSSWAQAWLDSGDSDLLTALLHSRCRFIGEMLVEVRTPKSADELLHAASEQYGLEWDTQTQISNRRGWLQSAGHVAPDADGRLLLTQRGKELLHRLELHPPITAHPVTPEPNPKPLPPPPVTIIEAGPASQLDLMAREIEDSSTDNSNPNRFERVVRDAFAFLGFEATLLGGSGRTDVLLDARLGRDESYRITVDAKTHGRGALPDQNVDWATLVEHRRRHDADYSLLVAPNPSTGRLTDRAIEYHVAVMSAAQLAGLCRQHARSPMTLIDDRVLFTQSGIVDTTDLDEGAEENARVMQLAASVCTILGSDSVRFGRLSARDLWLTLARTEEGEGSSEEEIQMLLDTLSSPLLRIVDGNADCRYALCTSPSVADRRLSRIGQIIAEGFEDTTIRGS